MTTRKSTAAEKATAARLRDLKHITEMALARHPSAGEVSITDMVKGEPKVGVTGKQADGQNMRGLAYEMIEVYDYCKQELAKLGYTGNGDESPRNGQPVRPKKDAAS